MYPLDIQEFATAVGVSNDVIGHLRECFEQQKAVDEYIHQRMLELVRLYLIVGGMPAAVQRYLDTNNLRRVLSELLKELNEKARFSCYESGFLWLKDAGVALPTYIKEPKVPLLLNKQRNLFKFFLNDVGLLSAMYGGNIQVRLLEKDTNINYGAVFENLVAQELYAHGFAMTRPFLLQQ